MAFCGRCGMSEKEARERTKQDLEDVQRQKAAEDLKEAQKKIIKEALAKGLSKQKAELKAIKEAKEQVKKIYLLAWKLKCKGITVYRYGSKEKQVLYKGAKGLTAKPEFAGGCPTEICP